MSLRLTLRTLLAYLDDTLEPPKAKEIGQKVAESEQAQELIDRIRTVMRRRRLIANAADPDATDLDANDVAEYIDNVLEPDKIGALEHACIDSDMNLAEVASVHQILTLVLGKPAEVSEECRDRMYGLIGTKGGKHSDRSPIGPRSSRRRIAKSPALTESQAIPLPLPPYAEGLAPGKKVGSVLVVMALSMALIIVLGIYLAPTPQPEEQVLAVAEGPVAQANDRAPLTKAIDKSDSAEKSSAATAVANDAIIAPAKEAAPLAIPAGSEVASTPAAVTTPSPVTESSNQPESATSKDGAAPSVSTDASIPAETPTTTEAQSSTGEGEAPISSPEDSEASPTDQPATSDRDLPQVPGVGAMPPVPRGDEMPPVPEDSETPPAPSGTAVAVNTPKPGEMDKEKATGSLAPQLDGLVPLATYVSAEGILLKYAQQKLIRMKKDEDFVYEGDEIINPEGYRSLLILPSKDILELVDQTRIVALKGSEESFHFSIPEGRFVYRLVGTDAKLKLKVGDQEYAIKIAGDKALVGGQVTLTPPPLPPMEDQPPTRGLELFVIRGELEITTGGQVSRVAGGNELVIGEKLGSGVLKPTDIPPSWIVSSDAMDQKAALKLAERVPYKSRIEMSLREEAAGGEKSARRLAVLAMSAIADVDGLISSLVQPNLADVREGAIVGLRRLLRQDPGLIPTVRDSLGRAIGPKDTETALGLLLGFSAEAQADRKTYANLIDLLDSEQLALRELSIFNLTELTGGKTYNYAAEAQTSRRRAAVTQWRRWLESERAFPPRRGR